MTGPRDLVEISRARNPFPQLGVSRDSAGVPHYDDLPATLPEMLAQQVRARPDGEAVVELGAVELGAVELGVVESAVRLGANARRLTYRQLWERASRVAGGLHAGGLERGDRVGLRYPAGLDWVLAFWGVLMAGGVPVAVNTRMTTPEVQFVLSDAGVAVDLPAGTPLPDGEPYLVDDLTTDDVAALFYTSGTTGRPKGVPTTHEAFLTNAENMMRSMGQTRDIGAAFRTLISVPLFHVTGCNSQLLIAAYTGGTAVIMPALDVPGLVESLTAERISSLITVPAVYALLLRHPAFADADVSGVRWVGYGGAPIAPTLVKSLQGAFAAGVVFNGYGMTETASLMTVLPHDEALEHADSVGYVVPSGDIGVVPIDGSGVSAGDPNTGRDAALTGDVIGELVVRGANVTSGYWNRPEATAATIVDGWLHTGDVVRVDDAGRVHIIDRLKDIINRGGENVSSVEVEAALLAAPGVSDACVLPVPDDVMGEKVGAVIFADQRPVDVPAVLEHCAGRLADFKIPQYVVVATEPLPRTASGKLRKDLLRQQVRWGEPLR